MTGNYYQLDVPSPIFESALLAQGAQVWHSRLAHIQPSTVLAMSKSHAIRGVEINNAKQNEISCTRCVLGKARRANIAKKPQSRATQLLELVHSDVNGSIEVPSLDGSLYFVTFTDYFSRWNAFYTMKAKSETFR